MVPALTCVKYHGSNTSATRSANRQGEWDAARRRLRLHHVLVVGASAPLDQKFLRKLDASYLIIDEAQKIKNANSIVPRTSRSSRRAASC